MPDNILTLDPLQYDTALKPQLNLDTLPKAPNVEISSQDQTNFDPVGETLTNMGATKSQQAKYAPSFFNWDESNADRYVGHKNYSMLGFDPSIGTNEQQYANHQTVWDQLKNTFEGGAVGTWQGIKDMALGWKDTASVFQDPTLQSAFKQDELDEISKKNLDFQNAYPIYQSSNENDFFSWNKLLRQVQGLGNLVGAVTEIGVENLAVGALTAATLGGTSELEAAEIGKTTLNAQRLSRTIDATANLKNSWNIFKESKSIDDAWNVVRNSSTILGSAAESTATGFLPFGNTLREAGTLLNPGRSQALLKTVGRGFGAFYADMRDLNLSINMAQTNASNTQHNLIQEETAQFEKNNGRKPNDLELQDIQSNSLEAAKKDGALNAITTLMLNKFAFSNVLTPNRALQEYIADQGLGFADRIGINNFKNDLGKLYLKDGGFKGFKQSLMNLPVGNYLGHGLGFGLTMNAMQAVDETIKSYYEAKYNHQNLSWADALSKGIDSQFTAEGAKTFISGVLTGAIVPGLIGDKFAKLRDKGIQFTSDKFQGVDSKARAERENTNATAASDFVDKFNKMWKDPLSENVANVILQGEFGAQIKSSLRTGDVKSAEDAKGDAAKLFLVDAAKNKYLDVYLDHLQDYTKNLTPEELFSKFLPNEEFTQEKFVELKEKLNDFQNVGKDVGKIHSDISRKFPNPYNPYKYSVGSLERDIEGHHYQTYKEAVALASFAKATTQEVIERQNKVFNGGVSDRGILNIPGFKDLSFDTAFSLTTSKKLDQEIQILGQELSATEPNTDVYKEIASKKNRLEQYKTTLEEYKDKYSILLKEKDNQKREDSINNLDDQYHDQFKEHLNQIVDAERRQNNLDPISRDDIEAATKKYLDYYKLGVEHEKTLNFTNFILAPDNWTRYTDAFKKAESEHIKRQAEKAQQAREEAALTKTLPIGSTTTDDTTPEQPLEETDKTLQQRLYLTNLIKDTTEKLSKNEVDRTKTQEYLDNAQKNLEGLRKELQQVEEKLRTIDPKRKGGRSKEIENAFKLKDELPARISGLEKLIESLQEQKTPIESTITTLTKYNELYQKSLGEIEKSGKYLNIGEKFKELTEQYKDQSRNLNLGTDIKQWIEDYQNHVSQLDKDINSLQHVTDDFKDTFRKLSKYSDIYDAIKNIKNYQEFKKTISDLYSKADLEQDEEKKKYIQDIIKNFNKLTEGKTLSEEDLRSLEDTQESKILAAIEGNLKNLDELLGEQGKLQQLGDSANQLRDLGDTIDYLKHLQGAFTEQEKNFEQTNTAEENAYKNGEGKDAPQLGFNPAQNHFDSRRYFTPEVLFSTTGRHYHPEHLSVELPNGKVYRYRVDTKTNEDKTTTKSLSNLDLSRLTDEEQKKYSAIKTKINSDEFINKPSNITYNDEDLKINHYANDEIENEDDNIKRSYIASSDLLLDINAEPKWFKVVYEGNDEYGIRNTQAYSEDIKVIYSDTQGNPLDHDNKKIKNPSKENILSWSLPGTDRLLSNIDKPTDEQSVEKAINEYISFMYTIHPELEEKDLKEAVIEYRNTIKYIRDSVKSGKPVKLNVIAKTQGIPNYESKVQNKIQKLPLHNRVIEEHPDYKNLRHPNGQTIKIDTKGNSLITTRQDGQELPINNRSLSTYEQENVLNALKYFSTLPKSALDESQIVSRYLKNTIFYGIPDKDEKVGANRIWIKNGVLFRSLMRDGKLALDKYIFSENEIDKNAKSIIDGMYHNVNTYTLKNYNDELYNEYKFDKKDNNWQATLIKEWTNYTHYLLAPRSERNHIKDVIGENPENEFGVNKRDPIIYTSLIEYNPEGEAQLKNVNLQWQLLDKIQPIDSLVVTKPLPKPTPKVKVKPEIRGGIPVPDKQIVPLKKNVAESYIETPEEVLQALKEMLPKVFTNATLENVSETQSNISIPVQNVTRILTLNPQPYQHPMFGKGTQWLITNAVDVPKETKVEPQKTLEEEIPVAAPEIKPKSKTSSLIDEIVNSDAKEIKSDILKPEPNLNSKIDETIKDIPKKANRKWDLNKGKEC